MINGLFMLKKIWIVVIFYCIKGLVSIRYCVRVLGLESLKPEVLRKQGGILFLPNHPSQTDPVVVLLALWPRFKPRPIVLEQFYYMGIGHYLMKLIQALPLPDLNGMVNKRKQKKIEKLFVYVSEELKKGGNFLIYPSGRLKVSGSEIIGGASFVHNLLKECPEANVVLIRTSGLWGSRFSKAITGMSPHFGSVACQGIKLVLRNGIFLTPRREVTLEIEGAPANFPYGGTRFEVNQYLEQWYNINGPELIKLIYDYFWKKQYPQITASKASKIEAQVVISPDLEKVIIEKLAQLTKRPSSAIQRNQYLSTDLGLDSLDIAQMYVFLDERYGVEGLGLGQLQTVEDVMKAAAEPTTVLAESDLEDTKREVSWPLEQLRPVIFPPQGETLQEAFLRICDRMDVYTACADSVYGILTYRRFKLNVLILANKLKHIEDRYIGVLLPSSSAAYMLIFAILLAGKIPLMLNWTVGVRALDHCVKVTRLKMVLSSRQFLNNLNNGDLGMIDDLLVLLEDLREELKLRDKLVGFYSLLKNADTLMKELKLKDLNPHDPALILFTSGTEELPKGVPLSHQNLISNQTSALKCVHFQTNDVFYGVFPPFHSFGLSVTGMLPLLAGIRSYFAPDPNDYQRMARDIESWQVTTFCCAPTFIKGLFHTASPDQLQALRFIVSGAEKAPKELVDYVDKMGGEKYFIEGYGITECGPMVTITIPGVPRSGVGTPFPGIELCVIYSEDHQRLSIGEEGEICIRGPNVFSGYLGTQKSPFIQLEGKEWYRSGDRGYLTKEGALVLTGRIKRFVKIGGEMVSLGGLEEELLTLAFNRQWPLSPQIEGPALAVTVIEHKSEKPEII